MGFVWRRLQMGPRARLAPLGVRRPRSIGLQLHMHTGPGFREATLVPCCGIVMILLRCDSMSPCAAPCD